MAQDCSNKPSDIRPMGRDDDKHIPRNLLDNLPHKRSPLAEVALRSRHTGLDNSRLGFLYPCHIYVSPSSLSRNEVKILPFPYPRLSSLHNSVHLQSREWVGNEDPPRGETGY